MADPVNLKYEVLEVLDVIAHASGDNGILVLKTAEGRVGLSMDRAVLSFLADEIRHALEREAPRSSEPS